MRRIVVFGASSAIAARGDRMMGIALAMLALACPSPQPPLESVEVAATAAGPVAEVVVPVEVVASPPRHVEPRPAADKPPRTPTLEAGKAFRAALRDGREATRSERYDAAIRAFNAALAAVPGQARALAGRGYAHLLAGELAAAEADLELALAANPSRELRAAVQFNLGLVAEQHGEVAEARRRYLLSNALRPSKSASTKLAGGTSTCTASIDREVVEPRRVASWSALALEIYGKAAPVGEAASRKELCLYLGVSPPAERCLGMPPWHLVNPFATTVFRHRLVLPDADGLQVLELPVRDYGSCEPDGEYTLLPGDPAIVRVEALENVRVMLRKQGDGVVDCEEDDDIEEYWEACSDNFTRYIDFLVIDPATLRQTWRIAVEGPARAVGVDGVEGGPTLAVTREAGGLRSVGAGCDEVVPLTTP